MRWMLLLTALLLTFVGCGAAGFHQSGSSATNSSPAGFRLATAPAYSLSVPPGGREGGRDISAHWFTVPGTRFSAGSDQWIMGSYYFPADMPLVRGWGVVWDFHTVGGDIGWPIGVSPVQLDITDGFLHVLTHGGGKLGTVDGIPQPVSTTNLAFPKLCQFPLLRDRWSDWVMHVKFDSRHGYVRLWQNGSLIVDASNVPTLYTDQKFIELWVGFYTNGASNPGKTFSMGLTLPRLGSTYREAAENTPAAANQWGSLEFDPSVVADLPARPPSAFVLPQSLRGRAACGR